MSWIVKLVLPAIVKRALTYFGASPAAAEALLPHGLNILKSFVAAWKLLRVKNPEMSDDELAKAAANSVLTSHRGGPSDKLTVEDILRSSNV